MSAAQRPSYPRRKAVPWARPPDSCRSRRRASPWSSPPPPQSPRSEPSYQEIALDGPSVQAETKPFAMVGITWPEGVAARCTAKVRVQRDGQWTDWEPLQVEDDHGPIHRHPEGIERSGTDPLWVGDATGVQASAVTSSGTTVSDAKVILIQPGVLATDADEPPASGVDRARGEQSAVPDAGHGEPEAVGCRRAVAQSQRRGLRATEVHEHRAGGVRPPHRRSQRLHPDAGPGDGARRCTRTT